MWYLRYIHVPIGEILVDIYYHFHHSAKRKEEFKEFLDIVDVEPKLF